VTTAARYTHRLPDRLDWYLLRALFAPMLLAVCVLLLAGILGRLLRLFELAAATGASSLLVLKMIGSLLPHYLGMALPAAFFAAIFMAMARSGDDNELDAMLATGRSITRMAMPCFLVAAALALFNLYLFGYLQPLMRYGYDATVHVARHTGWDARLEANRFVSVKDGFTLGADSVGADGRTLGGVFVERHDTQGEQVITAQSGRLVPSEDGATLSLQLDRGLMLATDEHGTTTVHFASGHRNEDFTVVAPPYQPRGTKVRQLTLPELRVASARYEAAGITAAQRAGEFHGRLAWSVLPLLLPLLALPLGMAAKRGRRAPGTVFAALALLGVWMSLQTGESMAEAGRAPAWLAVWLPLVLFAILGLWLFRSSLQWPGDNPVMRAVAAIEAGFEGLQKRRKASHK
jgi:lipopolysaccharide export system permease protein